LVLKGAFGSLLALGGWAFAAHTFQWLYPETLSNWLTLAKFKLLVYFKPTATHLIGSAFDALWESI